jgi:hypothetical protein
MHEVAQELRPGSPPLDLKLPTQADYAVTIDPQTGALISVRELGTGNNKSAVLGPARTGAGLFTALFHGSDQTWTLPDGSTVGLGESEPMLVTSFIGEYDTAGSAVSMTRTAHAAPKVTSVSVDTLGGDVGPLRTVITGYLSGGEALFGPGTPREATLPDATLTDGWAATYTPEGELRCAWSLGGPGDEHVEDGVVLPDGSLILVGKLGSTMDFVGGDGVHSGTATSSTPAVEDGFIARLGVVAP